MSTSKSFGEELIEELLMDIDYDIYKKYMNGDTQLDFSSVIEQLNELKDFADSHYKG